MSLITDPLYLIHLSRIKFLRLDERGERIISFPPNVMSDDYVRLAAPVYPEIQYCYSPVYDTLVDNNSFGISLKNSPRTTKRAHYRHRKQPITTVGQSPLAQVDKKNSKNSLESETSEDKPSISAGSGKLEQAILSPGAVETHASYITQENTSLHPSVDSAIDPTPHSSIDGQPPLTPYSNTDKEDVESLNTMEPLKHKKTDVNKQIVPSALSALIAEKATAAENPFAEYSFVSGRGENKPITLCVYLPFSTKPYEPVSLVVRPDAILDDVIGYILYDYVEQKREPELDESAYDLAEWVLLIAEDDGEVEDDLPALDRTRKVDRVSFDQFALCRATPSQVKQNDIYRAKLGKVKPDADILRKKKEAATIPLSTSIPAAPPILSTTAPNNTIIDTTNEPPYALINQQNEPDASTVAVPVPSSKATLTKATMPMTPLKYFRIKLMTSDEVSATTAIPVYAEMFIGDVLELVSRKRKLNPNEYMLTIGDSNIIIPNDTTVENMKGITDLTLTKKAMNLTIPSSSHLWRSPIKRKKDEIVHPMYFSTMDTQVPSTSAQDGLFTQYKKYTVSRKMPMFISKRVYILAIDGEHIHLMPPEHKGMFDSVKTTSFHANAVKSCKQSKKAPANFKVIILKDRDFKTYDLEAENSKEACKFRPVCWFHLF
ncbi:stress-activated map kinase interacting protein 1-domain-containing protein [Pilobolus umbonatus]|nr:stress-activated map kinase interacting protein 1-domain-containing protein [Pilobolus umbonatus]